MRYWFGGGLADWTFGTVTVDTEDDLAQLTGGVEVLFYNAETAGTQYTDLLDEQEAAVQSITSSDGSDGRAVGQLPPFQGPDGVAEMWASAAGGPRVLVQGRLLEHLLEADSTATAAAADLAAHVAQANGHDTALSDLTDVEVGTPESRTVGHVLGVVTGGGFELLAPSQVSGAVLLDPPDVAGAYVGNVASPPDSSQGSSGEPWLQMQQPYSGSDNNPDTIQLFSTTSGGTRIKTGWFNGNGEFRGAPSTTSRVGGRFFEYYESLGGPSTSRFFELSTNPALASNREPLLGAYGTGHSSKPGWIEATRVLSGLQGVRAGGSYNSLSALNWRGRRATTGAPDSGTWVAGDVVIDSAGAVYLCTVSGTPGTWVGSTPATPTSFIALTPGTNMGHGAKQAASRLDLGGYVARLRGELVASGSVASGNVVATIPTTAHRPLAEVVSIARYTGGGTKFTVGTNGEITLGNSLTAGQSVWIDSITWDLLA